MYEGISEVLQAAIMVPFMTELKSTKNGLTIAMQFLPSQAINFHKRNVDTNAVGHIEAVNKI